MIPIVPAVIPKSLAHAREVISTLTFSPEIHVDVVDGKFVPFISWPYTPAGEPSEVRDLTDQFTLEVDLMVEDPVVAGRQWAKAGADMLVFHIENTTPEELADFATQYSGSIIISALNSTPLSNLEPYLEWTDGIQLMGIAEIGTQGQAFDERVLDRIVSLKQVYPALPITIDGSVNAETIVRLKEAGADRFICGSAIVGATDPYLAHQNLSKLIN
ncbi:MAG: hypothetical protein R3B53_02005 [Candidatus Paceibacterota bacterium]